MPKSQKFFLKIAIVLLVIIVIGLLISLFPSSFKPLSGKSATSPTPTPNLSVTPFPTARPLPIGKQTLQVQSGDKFGSKYVYSDLVIDPLYVLKGEKQTVSVMVDYSSPINSVTLTTVSDNKSTPHELKLVEGTASSGKWEGTWIIDDDYNLKYKMDIEAVASSGTKLSLNPVFK